MIPRKVYKLIPVKGVQADIVKGVQNDSAKGVQIDSVKEYKLSMPHHRRPLRKVDVRAHTDSSVRLY